jgi:hypothetical protein
MEPIWKGDVMASSRRRASAHHANLAVRPNLKKQLIRAATSPTARTAYAVVGTVGLAALAIAIFGPKRFQREILKPVQTRVGDQAAQIWADSRPLREQIGKLFERAQSETGREKLVRSFQSWVGHFRAT